MLIWYFNLNLCIFKKIYKLDVSLKVDWTTSVYRIGNTLHVCTLLQIFTDVFCFKKKTPRHVENVIMMFTHVVFSYNALF